MDLWCASLCCASWKIQCNNCSYELIVLLVFVIMLQQFLWPVTSHLICLSAFVNSRVWIFVIVIFARRLPKERREEANGFRRQTGSPLDHFDLTIFIYSVFFLNKKFTNTNWSNNNCKYNNKYVMIIIYFIFLKTLKKCWLIESQDNGTQSLYACRRKITNHKSFRGRRMFWVLCLYGVVWELFVFSSA